MSSITFAELKDRVGRKLGVLTDGNSLSAEDGSIIGEALLDVQGQVVILLQSGFFDVENGIDNALADPFAEITAGQLVDEFGIPEPKRSELKNQRLGLPGRSLAERRLRALVETPTVKLQTTTDVYYT